MYSNTAKIWTKSSKTQKKKCYVLVAVLKLNSHSSIQWYNFRKKRLPILKAATLSILHWYGELNCTSIIWAMKIETCNKLCTLRRSYRSCGSILWCICYPKAAGIHGEAPSIYKHAQLFQEHFWYFIETKPWQRIMNNTGYLCTERNKKSHWNKLNRICKKLTEFCQRINTDQNSCFS